MKLQKNKLASVLALLGLLTLTLAMTVFAQQRGQRPGPPPEGPGGFGQRGPGGPGGRGGFGPMERELNLTDEQKAQMKVLQEGFEKKTAGLREQMFKGHDGPPAELQDGAFDEAAVRAAAQARANIQVELEVEHARLMSQMRALLTVEQKAKLAELRQQFEQRRRDFPPRDGDKPEGQ